MSDQITKTHITQQIDNLKNDIEQLAKKKKKSDNKSEILEYDDEKQKKMSQLKVLNQKLKEIYATERLQTRRKNEIRLTNRAVDSLDFGAAKKKRNPLAMEKAKIAKEIRDQTRNEYLQFLKIEENYLKNDPKTLPGCLFLHPIILKTYGLCPHLDIQYLSGESSESNENSNTTTEVNNISEMIYNLRSNWLKSQTDSGNLYFELYDNIFKKTELEQMNVDKNRIENSLTSFIENNLSESQLQIYKESNLFIKEYTIAHIKTKRLNEKYKTIINNLSILYSETAIAIHNFLSTKYNYTIVINNIDSKSDGLHNKFQRVLLIEEYNKMLIDYKNHLEQIQNKQKFYTNTLKNLNNDLYLFLKDKTDFVNKNSYLIPETKQSNVIVQEGKYFKKWSELSKEEQLERFMSFSQYFVAKVNKRNNTNEALVEKLYKLLGESFTTKKLTYKHFHWDSKSGFIDRVKILQYDNNYNFTLNNVNKDNNNDNNVNNDINNEKKINDTNVSKETKERSKQKTGSNRTIINKDTIKVINEELLYYIVKNGNVNENEEKLKRDKEHFLELIKNKLKIKKMTINDKTKILSIYDEIQKVVVSNKQQLI